MTEKRMSNEGLRFGGTCFRLYVVMVIVGGLAWACGPSPDRAYREAISCLKALVSDSTRPDVQGDAALALGRLKEASSLMQLKAGIQNNQEDIAFKSVQALGEVGGPEATAALRGALNSIRDPFVRAQIVVCLHRLGDDSAVPQLETALADSADPLRRASAASGLGKVGNRAAIPRLVHILERDGDFVPRSSAAVALGIFKDASTVPALAKALQEDPDEVVRIAVAQALARFGSQAAVSILEDALIHQTNYQLRKVLISCLVDAGGGKAIFPALRARFARTGNTVEQSLAAEALGRLGDREAIPLLKSVLQADPDEVVKLAAGEALGQLGEAPAMLATVQGILVTHTNDSFQHRAAEILVDYPDKFTLNTFKRLLTWHEDPELRAISARGIGQNGDRGGIVPLEKAVEHDSDENVRLAVVGALGAMSQGTARGILESVLASKDQTAAVRAAAARALRLRNGRDALRPLVEALHDSDARVRLEAAVGVIKLAKGIDMEGESQKK